MNFLNLNLAGSANDDTEESHHRKLGYKELAEQIIAAIENGTLTPQSILPPSRVLSEQLGVSRDTVFRCYKHLQSLHYVEAHGTRGLFVRDIKNRRSRNMEKLDDADVSTVKNRLSSYGKSMLDSLEPHSIAPDFPALNFGAVPPACLPVRRWRELMRSHAQLASVRNLKYDLEVLGRQELRAALAGYLGRSKGIDCSAAEIAVFNISFSAYSLLGRLILNPGDAIAMEEPGFGGIKNVAAYLGIDILPVPLDSEGISIDALEQAGRKLKLVYVTPNHQEPTGISMSQARRKQLLDWAERNDAWILEDDYDGFFHYGKEPPPTLTSLDQNGRVIYFGSFWELLYPLSTLGFLVVPPGLMPALTKSKILTEGIVDSISQVALAEMLDSGFLQKHSRKLERQFAPKRTTLAYELKRAFGDRIKIMKQSGGLTWFVEFSDWSDEQIRMAARASNFRLLSAEYYYTERPKAGQYVVYFPGLGNDAEIKKMVDRFHLILAGSSLP